MSDRDVTARIIAPHLEAIPEITETAEVRETVKVVWEANADQTVRVSFASNLEEDTDDGIPRVIEPETSATVGVHVVDIEEAMLPILKLAQRDKVSIGLIRTYDARPRASHAVPVDVQSLTGNEKVETPIVGLALTIINWKRFSSWFKDAIQESETTFFKEFRAKKASAIVFRLKLLADEVLKRPPLNNFLVLRLED